MAARIALSAPSYEPARKLGSASIPILVVVGEDNTPCPPKVTREVCARHANVEIVSFRGGHFDCCEGPEFERTVDEQLAFLGKHRLLGQSLALAEVAGHGLARLHQPAGAE